MADHPLRCCPKWRVLGTIGVGALTGALSAQNIDIGLYPTAVPDSFEVRWVSPSGFHTGIVNMTFTLRWDASAGGALNNSDVRQVCEMQVLNFGGVTVDGDYAYAVFNVLSLHPLSEECAITGTPSVLCGIRIRQLSGCRRVMISNDGHIWSNNGSYFISVGGIAQTGNILTGPVITGDCPPCEEPVITSATATAVSGDCYFGEIAFSAEATGSELEYLWAYGPNAIGTAAQVYHIGPFYTYVLVVYNACGSQLMHVDTELAIDTNCLPPVITLFTVSTTGCFTDPLSLDALVENVTCGTLYSWEGPEAQVTQTDQAHASFPLAVEGNYSLVVQNACGADTATVAYSQDTAGCVPPNITDIIFSVSGCNVVFHASVAGQTNCQQILWSGPFWSAEGSVSQTLYNAFSGTYQLVVINECGRDSMSVDVEVELDTAGCVPPEILVISYSGGNCLSPLYLGTNTTGSPCQMHHAWTFDGDTVATGVVNLISSPEPGTYVLHVSNPCGTDVDSVTALFDTTFVQCVPPEILSLNYTWGGCSFDTMTISATLRDTSSCLHQNTLTWPGSGIITSELSATLDYPQSGTYQLVALNECGVDTMSIYIDVEDPDCLAPEIIGITGNGPVCEGDTLQLFAEVTNMNGPCAIYDWTVGTITTIPASPFLVIPSVQYDQLSLLVSNACGADWEYFVDQVIAPSPTWGPLICETAEPYDLNTSLGFHYPGGTWTLNGIAHDSIFDPAIDSTGIFDYADPSPAQCPLVSVTITELPYLSTGTSGTVTLCSNDPPVNLFDYLGGDPDPGGSWRIGLGPALPGGVYDPATNNPGNWPYRLGSCAEEASHVLVIEIPATTWYLDVDNDGLGDSDSTVLGCDSIGFAANADDACPNLFGTIGSTCDDDLPETVNDVINATCTCVGDFPTGVDVTTAASTGFAIWPNPASHGPWTIVTGDLGQAFETVTFELVDVLGNIVLQRQLNVHSRSVRTTVNPGTALAEGLYMARLQAGKRSFVQRLVVK